MCANVKAPHELTEERALASLAGQSGRVSATRLAAQWGWPRGRVRRRLAAWTKAGLIPSLDQGYDLSPAARIDVPDSLDVLKVATGSAPASLPRPTWSRLNGGF
jgi:hypothetical protein